MLAAETGLPATLLLLGLVGWVMVQASLYLRTWMAAEPDETSISKAVTIRARKRTEKFNLFPGFAAPPMTIDYFSSPI